MPLRSRNRGTAAKNYVFLVFLIPLPFWLLWIFFPKGSNQATAPTLRIPDSIGVHPDALGDASEDGVGAVDGISEGVGNFATGVGIFSHADSGGIVRDLDSPEEEGGIGGNDEASEEMDENLTDGDTHGTVATEEMGENLMEGDTQGVVQHTLPLPPAPPESLESPRAVLTIITGSHRVPYELKKDVHKGCSKLAKALHELWTSWEPEEYAARKKTVLKSLKSVAETSTDCVLDGFEDFLWSFPLSFHPEAECDLATSRMLKKRSWVSYTKVHVPWFLQRPDLVTLNALGREAGVAVRALFVAGHTLTRAALATEGCPRFETMLRELFFTPGLVYKERLLLVAISDIQQQVSLLDPGAALLYNAHRTCRTEADPGALSLIHI